MVQGINWNSYSANQILEMKQKGVQVPDDVLKKAESSISEKDTKEITSESNDEKTLNMMLLMILKILIALNISQKFKMLQILKSNLKKKALA